MKNIKRLIFSALLLLALSSPLAASYWNRIQDNFQQALSGPPAASSYNFEDHIYYHAYVAGKGWQPLMSQREVAGLPGEGESRGICAIRIYTDSTAPIDGGVFYRVHLGHYYKGPSSWWSQPTNYVDQQEWSPWAWSRLADIVGSMHSDGSIDETRQIDGIEIKVYKPVPEYAIGLSVCRLSVLPPSGDLGMVWEQQNFRYQPPVGITAYPGYRIYGFSINVWGEGPNYPTL